ncbi:MAG: prepilin-type N-terminal cleavage/methylation domain-containing protein [Phycisphaerae bacterium]|nr:prepilin-type N-terminal cleavage/methylation domain-containing protein [Phycisphaerae bacterium]
MGMGIGRRRGFTLIELLVVVAIIALLISILLPSLSKARAQARATLCASRIGQLAKSVLVYADDYEETPPFIGVGYKECGGDRAYGNLGPAGRNTELYFAQYEQWLIPNLAGAGSDKLWLDTNWDQWKGTDKEADVHAGTLFPYTRFDVLYRCPEFERITGSGKTQNVFNYSRSLLARKLLSSIPSIGDRDAEGPLHPGTILKSSAVYNPAAMYMLIDEQWDFHCAGNYNEGGIDNLGGCWMAAETIHGLVFDMWGSYHGTTSNALGLVETLSSKKANMAYYDGHVDLFQDPLPYRTAEEHLLALLIRYGPDRLTIALHPIMQQLYAQRGLAMTTQVMVEIVGELIN